MIFFGNEEDDVEEKMWDKSSIESVEGIAMLQKKRASEELNIVRNLPLNNSQPDDCAFTFVVFEEFLTCNRNWCNRNIQTVGVIKFSDGHYHLHGLFDESKCCVLTLQSAAWDELNHPEMFVHVFGYPVFYASHEKIIPISPEDCLGHELFITFHIINLLNLENFANARRLLFNLCRILFNNCNKNVPCDKVTIFESKGKGDQDANTGTGNFRVYT
ncbi:hypothetical protein FQA39_LY01109 [Lamprigera yunnana]|nr:hypothetical protein FQA39_LY01109 [Lamprigera yunnana]